MLSYPLTYSELWLFGSFSLSPKWILAFRGEVNGLGSTANPRPSDFEVTAE